jgi:hypothetical protein
MRGGPPLRVTASEVDEIDFGPAGDSATELTDG